MFLDVAAELKENLDSVCAIVLPESKVRKLSILFSACLGSHRLDLVIAPMNLKRYLHVGKTLNLRAKYLNLRAKSNQLEATNN